MNYSVIILTFSLFLSCTSSNKKNRKIASQKYSLSSCRKLLLPFLSDQHLKLRSDLNLIIKRKGRLLNLFKVAKLKQLLNTIEKRERSVINYVINDRTINYFKEQILKRSPSDMLSYLEQLDTILWLKTFDDYDLSRFSYKYPQEMLKEIQIILVRDAILFEDDLLNIFFKRSNGFNQSRLKLLEKL